MRCPHCVRKRRRERVSRRKAEDKRERQRVNSSARGSQREKEKGEKEKKGSKGSYQKGPSRDQRGRERRKRDEKDWSAYRLGKRYIKSSSRRRNEIQPP